MKKLFVLVCAICMLCNLNSFARIVEITSKEAFQNEQQVHDVTVAFFWRESCVPCLAYFQIIQKVHDEFGDEYYDKICIAKCNTDKLRRFAVEIGVVTLPTIIIYKGKEIRWFFTDYKDERELRNMIGVLLSE